MARPRITPFHGTVLVADDHEVLRFGLLQLLRNDLGVGAALQASNFEEALGHIADVDLVLAIFDLGMPGLNSPSDLAEVRRRRPDVRVVVLSASEDRADILAALEAGVHGYMIKNARMDLLVERLSYVMSGEIYVPSMLADQAGIPARSSTASEPRSINLMHPRLDLDHQTANHPNPLSDRQRQVLEGLVMGHSNKQIARELKLAEGTVKMHIGALFRALGANNRAHAAALGKKLLD